MRAFAAALLLCVLVFPAHAGWMIPTHTAQRIAVRNHETGPAIVVRSALSAACHLASSLGGPCGCFASEQVFGHSVRDLWLADAWLKFPRTTAHSGAVAIWPHRHVAMVGDVKGGLFVAHDSWGDHWVSTRGRIFVEPRRYAGL